MTTKVTLLQITRDETRRWTFGLLGSEDEDWALGGYISRGFPQLTNCARRQRRMRWGQLTLDRNHMTQLNAIFVYNLCP